jgi:hypothetical protein
VTDIEKIMLYVAFIAAVLYLWERMKLTRRAAPAPTAQPVDLENETPEQFYARWIAAHGGT